MIAIEDHCPAISLNSINNVWNIFLGKAKEREQDDQEKDGEILHNCLFDNK
jgi:hypothetical protein